MSEKSAVNSYLKITASLGEAIEQQNVRIANLEEQLAEKDKEIERMRAVVESVCVTWYRRVEILRADAGDSTLARYHILSCISDLRHEYEQSTKPDGGTET